MSLREKLDGGQVKGVIFRTHKEWAIQEKGVDWGQVVRKISNESRATIAAPFLEITFYPFRSLIEMDRAIVSVLDADTQQTVEELGRHSARLNLSTSYKVFVKKNPHDFYKTTARIHGRFQDFGRGEYEKTGEKSCRISFLDYPCWSKVYCWSARGYLVQAAEMTDAQNARVNESSCHCRGDDRCSFDISWS